MSTPCTAERPCGRLVPVVEANLELARALGRPPQRVYRCLGCHHDRWTGIPADLPTPRIEVARSVAGRNVVSEEARVAWRRSLNAARQRRWIARRGSSVRASPPVRLPVAVHEMLTRVPVARSADRVPTPSVPRSRA